MISHKELFEAAKYGDTYIILEYILEDGNVNIRDEYDRSTLLHDAVYFMQATCAEMLINNGANINVLDTNHYTPLHRARSIECMQLLITAGADVNMKNKFGQMPLHIAIYNEFECVELLINSGAHINVTDNFWTTPLHIAAMNHDYECIEILVHSGADIHIKNSNGETCMNIGSWDNKEIIIEVQEERMQHISEIVDNVLYCNKLFDPNIISLIKQYVVIV